MAGEDVTLGEVSRKLDSFALTIGAQLSELKADLRTKADGAQFDRLEGRFDSLEARTEKLETWRHDKEIAANVHAQRDERVRLSRKAWAGIITACLGVAASLTLAVSAILAGHG